MSESRKESLGDEAARIALLLLFHLKGWKPVRLAEALGMQKSQVSRYTQGLRKIPRSLLERTAVVTGFPVSLLDPMVWMIRSFQAAMQGTLRAEQVLKVGLSAELIAVVQTAVDVVLSRPAPPKAPDVPESPEQDRLEAEALWRVLENHSVAERLLIVAELEELHTWALCERAARESIRAAPNAPAEARKIAELALAVAERVPGRDTWRWRIQGYAWAHLANALHSCNDLPGAADAMARGRKLWEAGAPGDPGVLNPAWVPGLEASLLRSRRRFAEALERIEEALALDQGDLRGQILLIKARIFETLGDPESSTATLLEAAPLIDPEQEPRLALYLRFNLLVALSNLCRFAEVEAKLPEVRALAERLGGELDLTRVSWLEAKCAAGLGRIAEARAAFEDARRVFERHGLTFNYALVSLELSLLLLEQGNTAEVSRLAVEMLRIFQAQQVEPETLAALRVFCDAARRETVTIELARKVVKFLYRAQHDPELRFEAE